MLHRCSAGFLLAAFALLSTAQASAAMNEDALWTALASGGHVAIMRHALAPGTGDPASFQLDDCSTQRNLDDVGREQARRTGTAFRDRNVQIGQVFSSLWCRCLDTAELLEIGTVTPLPALNSFFRDRGLGPSQTAELRRLLAELEPRGPSHIMVTHQVNITALTDIFPRSGEIVVLRLNGTENAQVLGRISAL